MSRLMRARLWLGAAGVGALVTLASALALLRSCDAARMPHVGTFASLSERDALYWSRHASRPR